MLNIIRRNHLLYLSILFLVSCNLYFPQNTVEVITTQLPDQDSLISVNPYPGPEFEYEDNRNSLPFNNIINEPYPAPHIELTIAVNIVPIKIVKPVIEGESEVRVTGPEGLPLVMADVTFAGEYLGKGKIGPGGEIVIKLNSPLQNNHRIGVMLSEMTETRWDGVDFSNPGYFGTEFQQIPMIGFFYDTAMVQQK